MQQTNFDMINNRVKTAKFKLDQHKNLGTKSSLSVFQAARLMDTIKFESKVSDKEQQHIFFSWN